MHRPAQQANAASFLRRLTNRSARWRRRTLRSLTATVALGWGLLVAVAAFGGSATWNLNPADGVWQTATNWIPATVPSLPSDIATFGVSNKTSITNDTLHNIDIDGMVFKPGASAFTISFGNSSFHESYSFNGAGITNDSGMTQSVAVRDSGDLATLVFKNSATAGTDTVFTTEDDLCSLSFQDTSTAGDSTLIAYGGAILFEDDSSGGTARVELSGTGTLDLGAHNAPGVSVESIEGDGVVQLGGNNLTVGGNVHNAMFSGLIEDNGLGGSLTKAGRRSLILENANTYSGGTTIRGGHLFVRNRKGSGTGSGPVEVNAGRLGGGGIIAGPVTVGTASGNGSLAELSPGDAGAGPGETLTCLSSLTFHAHGTYLVDLDSDNVIADLVTANGVTIRNRASLRLTDFGLGILRSSELYDSGTGLWSPTTGLATSRSGHSATVLPDGMVLVAGGGQGFGHSLASAELYDPANATWSATGSLATARSIATATLLPNGKVLVAGGDLGFGPTASAELYDPASGTWTPTGNMTSARYYHTANLLPDGRVLVVGSPGVATAELYDPSTGTWATTGRPITSRWSHTATLLPNGKILVAGGSTGIGLPTAFAELYDPITGLWARTGSLTTARQVHAATLLPDGLVLVVGGQGPGINELRSAELYDPASGIWMTTGSLAIPRAYHTVTLLPNGKVLTAGGNNGINFMEASVELYDPASGSWTTTDSLDPGRYSHTANLLQDGRVLVAGGIGFGLPVGTVFTLISNTSATPISGTFSNLPDGSNLTVGGKKCQVSYSGGDGNDLTLTVVQ